MAKSLSSQQSGQLGHLGANRPKGRQAVCAAFGTSGPKGRAGRGNPNWLKVEKFLLTFERN
ncbi:hypothetical protein KI387_033971, partial [Taxus chinensis]